MTDENLFSVLESSRRRKKRPVNQFAADLLNETSISLYSRKDQSTRPLRSTLSMAQTAITFMQQARISAYCSFLFRRYLGSIDLSTRLAIELPLRNFRLRMAFVQSPNAYYW